MEMQRKALAGEVPLLSESQPAPSTVSSGSLETEPFGLNLLQ